ncbi:hypothetical protein ABT187_41865 [Streptomyces sp. NPDC001817]|uniref:hypothetical protein n=1 Tax=Streptomyces sp. NPDC001817 TaxID=3154398 RepID=UPI00331B1F4C
MESTDHRLRTAILIQVRRLAEHGAAEDGESLARAAYEAWSALADPGATHELTAHFPHLDRPGAAEP